MKTKILFPESVLKPIKRFLHLEEKRLEERKKILDDDDPFSDTGRVDDNSPDADAAEQFGHARVEAMRKEIDRRLIEIRKALTKIKIGRYGICEKCGKMIDTDRLMIKPEATLCVKCEKEKEK